MDWGMILGVIAIVVAVVIGGWQIYLALKQNRLSALSGKSAGSKTTEYRKRPYPKEIINEIDKLAPFQRETVMQSYLGLKFDWEATFFDISLLEKNIAHVILRDHGHYPWIYCDIDLNEYPQIKIAKTGDELRILGCISNIKGNTITLSNCLLEFED